MMDLLLAIALTGVAVFVISSVMIVSDLHSRGHKINWFLLRLYIPKYAHEYNKIHQTETGRTGVLFKVWLVSINTALAASVAALLIKVL